MFSLRPDSADSTRRSHRNPGEHVTFSYDLSSLHIPTDPAMFSTSEHVYPPKPIVHVPSHQDERVRDRPAHPRLRTWTNRRKERTVPKTTDASFSNVDSVNQGGVGGRPWFDLITDLLLFRTQELVRRAIMEHLLEALDILEGRPRPTIVLVSSGFRQYVMNSCPPVPGRRTQPPMGKFCPKEASI